MMRYLKYILFLFVATRLLAIDVNSPVVRVVDGDIVEKRGELPNRYDAGDAVIVNYKAATYRHDADGWKQAILTSTDQVVTNPISLDVQIAMQLWEETAQIHFNSNHLNGAVTEEQIKSAIKAKLDAGVIDRETVSMLKAAKDELRAFWPHHLSTLPYGETEYITTNTVATWGY